MSYAPSVICEAAPAALDTAPRFMWSASAARSRLRAEISSVIAARSLFAFAVSAMPCSSAISDSRRWNPAPRHRPTTACGADHAAHHAGTTHGRGTCSVLEVITRHEGQFLECRRRMELDDDADLVDVMA